MAGLWTWLREDVWEIRFRRYVALVLAAALVAVLFWVGRTMAHDDRSCATGVVKPEGSKECVGVSSTSYFFDRPQLADTVRAIVRENHRLKSGSYVTVALFEPFTSTDADNLADVQHELQGAYLAQWGANHESTNLAPKIRLVLANPGATGAHWEHTVDQLDRMKDGPDRLRAVTGIGLSTKNNKRAVKELTNRGIPVIGSSITADDLANSRDHPDAFPGLARVSPTNTDEARALASFANVSAAKSFLVYDSLGDDPYANTLKTSFERMLKGAPYESQSFRPPRDRSKEGTTANSFWQITNILCNTEKGTDTVLFAGRHTQLRQFINALGQRGCTSHKFTLLTGDEGSYLSGDKDLDKTALQKNLSVQYTALAHPDAWLKDAPATGGSKKDAEDLNSLLSRSEQDKEIGPIGKVALDDGQLIIAYDAMRLAVRGIRGAAPDGKAPTLADVGDQWSRVKGEQLRVNGASGWICLDARGNPYDKAVPIVELTPKGVSEFVRIAWPEGKPPEAPCLPPSTG